MDADGMNPTPLTDSPLDDSAPSWSPDGKSITFSSKREGNDGEIYTMSADGSNEKRVLPNSPGDEGHPDWGVPTPPPPPPPDPTTGDAKAQLLPSLVRVNRRTGRGRVSARCDNAAADVCNIALALTVPRPRAHASARRRLRVGTVRGKLAGQKSGKLTVRLNRRGRALLHKRGKLRTRAKGSSRNNAGAATAMSATLRVKPKRRK